MAREQFKALTFYGKGERRIDAANAIIAEYEAQGLRLTLRQLYYQFVSRDLIPNTQKDYKALGETISNGRLAGLIDWDAIEDRVRVPRRHPQYNGLDDLVADALASYRLPRWQGQPCYAELWVEKDALAGVLEPLASEFHAVLMVNRGYSSQSAMYESAARLKRAGGDGDRPVIVFYVGDHDPSGEDMVRDISDRLEMFGLTNYEVRKLALTTRQIAAYKPPPNPVKMKDSRSAAYKRKHGAKCWEVDALRPEVLAALIKRAFEGIIDREKMDAVIRREEKDARKLKRMVAKKRRKGRKPRRKSKPKARRSRRKPARKSRRKGRA